ncbi:MAG: phosphatase PAP2 family protein [Alphaproteobacteria bacterium]|jgi:undecaprenyl-diphosphatase|nr:phosphatase PAP2 family protein [Alphaproteobacteria bacterium]
MFDISKYRSYFPKTIKSFRNFVYKQPLLSAIIFLCLGSFFAFSKLASEILEGEGRVIDTKILLLMRDANDHNNPLGPHWVEEIMRDITSMGGITMLTFITLASALYLFLINKKGLMVYLLATVSTGVVFINLLKIGFDRPRPDLIPHDVVTYTASFPSGHSLISAVVYLTLGSLLAEIQPRVQLKIYIISLAAFITLLVGISRIYLGVHWPSDVLAGWFGGAAWACMFWIIAHYTRKIN